MYAFSALKYCAEKIWIYMKKKGLQVCCKEDCVGLTIGVN